MATKANKTKDFDVDELLAANESHEQKIAEIEDRVGKLEEKILTNECFAVSFCDAAKNDKRIDEVVNEIVDKHDKHKIIINGIAVLKWAAGLVIGGLIGALITVLVVSK